MSSEERLYIFSYCKCGNLSENLDTGDCASCAHAKRKEERAKQKGKKVYKIRKVSKKQSKELKSYSKVREEYLKDHPFCELKLVGCTMQATDIHHTAKRGKALNSKETFISACRHCHTILETKLSAQERREKGFLI